MTYWLCITTEENWEIIRKRNLWGVTERERNLISKVKPGDMLVFYVKMRVEKREITNPRIVGVYKVVSEPYRDSSKIFRPLEKRKSEVFPYRMRIEPVKIFSQPKDFKSFVGRLNFIKNKRKWSAYLRGKSMKELPEGDFKLLVGR